MMGLEQATILTAHSCRCMGGGGQSPRICRLLHSCSSVKISEQGCRQTIRVDAPNAYDHRAKCQVSVKRDHPWEKGDKYIWEERSSGTMYRAVPSPASYYTQREAFEHTQHRTLQTARHLLSACQSSSYFSTNTVSYRVLGQKIGKSIV